MINSNYILIHVANNQNVELYYFSYNHRLSTVYNYPICFVVCVRKIDQLFILLSLFNQINCLSTRHKLYLGKEIYKAKISTFANQIYIQD